MTESEGVHALYDSNRAWAGQTRRALIDPAPSPLDFNWDYF